MHIDDQPILGIPTNIITGFLGVGKTSAILNLIKNKPDHERWAVLVNEFGEIGVDGSLVQGQHHQEQQIFIREVPGGCMCCTAGLPMQIALNQLLLKAKPDRLLIEPTGLGHPKEVLQALSTEYYREVLLLQRNITLVDARNLSDVRYTQHDTFNQQIAIADTVVANKQDLYQAGDSEKLHAYVAAIAGPSTKVIFAEYGKIALTELENVTASNNSLANAHDHDQKHDQHEHNHKHNHNHNHNQHHHEHDHKHDHHNHDHEHDHKHDHHNHDHKHGHHDHSSSLLSEQPIPESGMLKAINEGEGFVSIGWRFSANKVFDQQKLQLFLSTLKVERMKAVLITDRGLLGYNLTADGLSETKLDECVESRIELISELLDETLEKQLLACIKR